MNITNYICISGLVLCCNVCFDIILKVVSHYVDIVVWEIKMSTYVSNVNNISIKLGSLAVSSSNCKK